MVEKIVEFDASSGSKFGSCVILKETKNKDYSLIFSPKANEFVVVSRLNIEKGSWLSGTYFGDDLDGALERLNSKEIIFESQEERGR